MKMRTQHTVRLRVLITCAEETYEGEDEAQEGEGRGRGHEGARGAEDAGCGADRFALILAGTVREVFAVRAVAVGVVLVLAALLVVVQFLCLTIIYYAFRIIAVSRALAEGIVTGPAVPGFFIRVAFAFSLQGSAQSCILSQVVRSNARAMSTRKDDTHTLFLSANK